jgi:uncharacterized membrane protein YjdF
MEKLMPILIMIAIFFLPYIYFKRTRISGWWKEKIWKPLCRNHADKLAHYIGLREFTSFLKRTGLPIYAILLLTIGVSILKELIDWWKGEGIDPFDLLADGLGILMGFIN